MKRDTCKACGTPWDKKNTRHKRARGADGKVRWVRECRNCNRRREAARRERVRRSPYFVPVEGKPRLAGTPQRARRRAQEEKLIWSVRRLYDFCRACEAGQCNHTAPCLNLVARPPADHVCKCGDVPRTTKSQAFNPTLRRA